MTQQEPIFHDRQSILGSIPITTSSLEFVPIVESLMTTKDLGQNGIYLAWLSVNLQHNSNSSTIIFRTVINGLPLDETITNFQPGSANDPIGRTFIAQSNPIPAGSSILFEWKTDKGIAQINRFQFIIDGIPEIRVLK